MSAFRSPAGRRPKENITPIKLHSQFQRIGRSGDEVHFAVGAIVHRAMRRPILTSAGVSVANVGKDTALRGCLRACFSMEESSACRLAIEPGQAKSLNLTLYA